MTASHAWELCSDTIFKLKRCNKTRKRAEVPHFIIGSVRAAEIYNRRALKRPTSKALPLHRQAPATAP